MDVKLLQPLSTTSMTIAGLKLTPEWYSHSAIGGPYQALLIGEGEELAMMSAISAVGAGVEIYSDFSDKVWWGKLYETILTIGAVTIKTSLDNLRNKIKVLYTLIDSITGEQSGQLETDWEYDTESILRYGLREFIYTSDATSEAAAETQRHNLLLAMKDPKPVITTAGTKGGGKASLQVRCKGWFDDLDYRYYSKPFDETSYQEGGYGWLQFGKSTTYQKAAMSLLVDATDDLGDLGQRHAETLAAQDQLHSGAIPPRVGPRAARATDRLDQALGLVEAQGAGSDLQVGGQVADRPLLARHRRFPVQGLASSRGHEDSLIDVDVNVK